MVDPNDPNKYYYRHKLDANQIPIDSHTLTTRIYLNRLTGLQVFSTCVIVIASCLQAIAIGTSDWFVLNVNEYIPTSKGGLWNYCYVSSSGLIGHYTCLRYEDLPNFAIFVNSRLYDSRILLICSCGFCLLIMLVEVFGILCLCFAESKGDLFDTLIAKNSSTFKEKDKKRNVVSPKIGDKIAHVQSGDDSISSSRFTTSIVVNPNQAESYRTKKPTGYYAYLMIALITLVGSVMDFVLKVCGFALFDSYINRLLSLNTVFLAYRSYGYWMMIVSMVLVVFYWLFKVFSTKYVINLTRKLVETKEKVSTGYSNSDDPFDSFKPSKISKNFQ